MQKEPPLPALSACKAQKREKPMGAKLLWGLAAVVALGFAAQAKALSELD